MGKPKAGSAPPPGQYRDEPDRDDAASTSSALLMNDIEYNDNDLPAYDDGPYVPPQDLASGIEASRPYLLPNEIPFSQISSNETTRVSIYPYDLEALIRAEMLYPPQYYIRIHGTHTETHRTHDDKTEKRNITDFDIKLNMTHLLICSNPTHQRDPIQCYQASSSSPMPCRYVHCLVNGEKGYRGGIFPSTEPSPSSSDPEHGPASDEIQAWVQSYLSSSHTTKSFTLAKLVSHHQTDYLLASIRQLVTSTSYRGHLQITFPVTHSTVKVYSNSLLNRLRFNRYVCWFFYLTFLWLLSWPLIFLLEHKWAPIVIHYPYKHLRYHPTKPTQRGGPAVPDGMDGKPLVESEQVFFRSWQKSISRAVTGRHVGWIDGLFKADTDAGVGQTIVRSGNEYVDSFIGGAIAVNDAVHGVVGWGADS